MRRVLVLICALSLLIRINLFNFKYEPYFTFLLKKTQAVTTLRGSLALLFIDHIEQEEMTASRYIVELVRLRLGHKKHRFLAGCWLDFDKGRYDSLRGRLKKQGIIRVHGEISGALRKDMLEFVEDRGYKRSDFVRELIRNDLIARNKLQTGKVKFPINHKNI